MAQTGTFEVVDAKAYAKSQLVAGAQVVVAEKAGRVLARPAKEGEQIDVWTKNGNFEGSETAHEGEMILTRADDNGQPVLDSYGHNNSWKMSAEKFMAKYDTTHPDPETGAFKPAGAPQTFVQVGKDISLKASWGEVQNIRQGGYLNITDPKDVYGIAREEFQETYKVLRSITRQARNAEKDRLCSDKAASVLLPNNAVKDAGTAEAPAFSDDRPCSDLAASVLMPGRAGETAGNKAPETAGRTDKSGPVYYDDSHDAI